MEPLFSAVSCGCQAGLLRDALHEVYLPRIQRGETAFAATVLGARTALLSVLARFFEPGRWGSLVHTAVEGQCLTAEDELCVLMQAGLCLTATRGFAAPEARLCYERAEPLCQALHRPALLYVALMGRYRYSLVTDRLTATLQIAERIHSVAQQQNDAALLIGAHRALAATLYFMGEFEAGRQHARRGVQLWRSGGIPAPTEEVHAPAVICLGSGALCEWHLGEVGSSQAAVTEAIALAKALKDTHALALALFHAAFLGYFERKPAVADRLAMDLIELSTRQNFALWLSVGEILRGWARSVSGDTAEGLGWIERGIANMRAMGWMLSLPYWLATKAEALHLAERTYEALEVIQQAEAAVENSEERSWEAELKRLRGVFLAAVGADKAQIEAAFREAIRTARQQKSVSLMRRAEASHAEYCRQRASG
jgi:predicted ATPase